MSFVHFSFLFTYTVIGWEPSYVLLGGISMFLEKEDDFQEEEHDDDEGRELKTISIAEYVKMRREQRKKNKKSLKINLKC